MFKKIMNLLKIIFMTPQTIIYSVFINYNYPLLCQ